MTGITLEELGISKEELANRVVDACVTLMLMSVDTDEDSERPSQFQRQLKDQVVTKIDEAINDIAAKHLVPRIGDYIENLTIQETNKFGEERGEPTTFIEYLTHRADHYLREDVDFHGKPRSECRSGGSFSKSTTRIAHMVDAHLHYSIKTAMEQAPAVANSSIAGGIEEAVKLKLAEILKSLKVEVKTGR